MHVPQHAQGAVPPGKPSRQRLGITTQTRDARQGNVVLVGPEHDPTQGVAVNAVIGAERISNPNGPDLIGHRSKLDIGELW